MSTTTTSTQGPERARGTRRRRLTAVAALVGLPTGLLVGAAAALSGSEPAGAASAGSAATVLRFVEKPSSGRFIDLPPKATSDTDTPSAGDEHVFIHTVHRRGERVGGLHVVCVVSRKVADPDRIPVLCQGVLRIPGGTISGTALVRTGKETVHVAVTGGTGRYAGASGTMLERHKPNGTMILTVTLE